MASPSIINSPKTPSSATLNTLGVASSSALRRPKKTPATSKFFKFTPGQLKEKAEADAELARQRAESSNRLRTAWEVLFEKYGKDFEGITDEIDLATGEIVVDNGHLLGLESLSEEDDLEDGEEEGGRWEGEEDGSEPTAFTWGGKVSSASKKKRKRGNDSNSDASKAGSKKTKLDPSTCEHCLYQDELDDSVCEYCSVPNKETLPDHEEEKQPNVNTDTSACPSSPQLPPREIEPLAMDDPKFRKSGLRAVALAETTKTGISSPFTRVDLSSSPPPIPQSSPLRNREALPAIPRSIPGSALKFASSPGGLDIPEEEIDELSMPSPLPSARGLLQQMSPFGHVFKSTYTPQRGRKGSVMRMTVVEIPSSSDPMQVDAWDQTPTNANRKDNKKPKLPSESKTPVNKANSKAKVKTPKSAESLHKSTTKSSLGQPSTVEKTTVSTVPTKLPATVATPLSKRTGNNIWSAPPPELDPFYNPKWCDEHPDGEPEQFPSRPVDHIFRTPALPATRNSPRSGNRTAKTSASGSRTKPPASTPSKKVQRSKVLVTPGWTKGYEWEAKMRMQRGLLDLMSDFSSDEDDEVVLGTLRKKNQGKKLEDEDAEAQDGQSVEVDDIKEGEGTETTPIEVNDDAADQSIDASIPHLPTDPDPPVESLLNGTKSADPPTPAIHSVSSPTPAPAKDIYDISAEAPRIPEPSTVKKTPVGSFKTPSKVRCSQTPVETTPSTVNKSTTLCETRGFRCTKMFCFKCMGFEGDEDDLI